MTAPQVKVCEIWLKERPVKLRLPFRFGVVTLTQAPQAFVRVRITTNDGREAWGCAAELMVPKWFDKSEKLSNEDNFDQLRASLHLYAQSLLDADEDTPFELFSMHYQSHIDESSRVELNPLVAGFGPALIDRAIFDAVCRAYDVSMAQALQNNLAGMSPQVLLDEFNGFEFDRFLKSLKPLSKLDMRHTVGLVDPLTAHDLTGGARVDDGLPETLEEIIDRYKHTYFKIKVGGDVENDIERLTAIAQVLERARHPYKITLDGNEQYESVDGVLELLSAMHAKPQLAPMLDAILFIEQPIHRAHALERDVGPLTEHFPVIIDESDGDLDAFPIARRCGYTGVSTKDCKGFYKSLINLARCRMWSKQDNKNYFMSAEDLTCQAGLAVQQDLALVALLGVSHVERNGHHYVNGMAGASADEQTDFLNAHSDLYTRNGDRVSLRIVEGQIAIGSLQCAGYGSAVEPDWSNMNDMNYAVSPAKNA